VDILLVGGGIDCDDADPLRARLGRFDHRRYRYETLVYAGNAALADDFLRAHPHATVIENPMREGLAGRSLTVFEALRRAYLDDLVHKEGISELRPSLARGIRPTPEVVSRGFLRALQNRSSIKIAGACILMDIGGATTDFHYTVEIVSDDSEQRPVEGSSVARYVFVDLGVVASRDSTLLQLRSHPRLYEFLSRTMGGDVQDAYQLLREGEYAPSSELLSYACVFLGLDRFAQGHGPGLPKASLGKVAELILSGGAAQMLDTEVVLRLFELLAPTARPEVLIDRRYQIWVDGITWTDDSPH
ncbi:MAG: glutamate mutase L, partial [Burkholderiaceae bacterium]|nr:glutamate mutase L [Burkholderiaceae bacterium]